MSKTDLLHRFVFDHCDIRGEIVTITDSFAPIVANNPYPPGVTRLLGEFVAAAALLSSTLKFDGTISLQARGEGAVSLIMAECSHHREVRAIVRPREETELPPEGATLRDILGQGVLAITLTPSRGERYQGIVPLDADNLAGCLEHYFQQSEQLTTRLWLAASAEGASGLLLQALPQQVASAEQNADHWQTLEALTDTLTAQELLDVPHETLLYRLYHEQPPRLFSPTALHFHCRCSRERSAEALRALGRQEVEALLAERGAIDIDCQFCNQHYHFDTAAVRELFGPATLH